MKCYNNVSVSDAQVDKFQVFESGSKRFNYDFIYLGVYCLKGCSIGLNIEFQTDIQGKDGETKPKRKSRNDDDSDNSDYLED